MLTSLNKGVKDYQCPVLFSPRYLVLTTTTIFTASTILVPRCFTFTRNDLNVAQESWKYMSSIAK